MQLLETFNCIESTCRQPGPGPSRGSYDNQFGPQQQQQPATAISRDQIEEGAGCDALTRKSNAVEHLADDRQDEEDAGVCKVWDIVADAGVGIVHS